MAISTLVYNNLLEKQNDGSLPDLEAAGALDVLLLQVDDDGNETTQRSRASVSAILASAATELTSTGYSRKTLTGVAVTRDDDNNVVEVSANDVDFTELTQAASETIVGAVVYIDNGTDAGRIPLWKVTATAGDIVTPNGEKFFLRFNGSVAGAGGILWRSGQGTL
jgi:hypothetical protein